MPQNPAILLTGASGFLGSHVVNALKKLDQHSQLLTPTQEQLNLLNPENTRTYLEKHKPNVIIHCAAACGGIQLNLKHPFKLFNHNLLMGLHLIDAAVAAKTTRIVYVGTTCSYPERPDSAQAKPTTELHKGRPHYSNSAYGLAKLAVHDALEAAQREYQLEYNTVIPSNLYGPNDHFNSPSKSHVIPALIQRIYDAKRTETPSVNVWGNGTARREFTYAPDAATAIAKAALCSHKNEVFNVGSGETPSIATVAKKIAKLLAYEGEIKFNHMQPTGEHFRLLESSPTKRALEWLPLTSFDDGLAATINSFTWNKNTPQPNTKPTPKTTKPTTAQKANA